ncbi:MAG: Rrf2 family transcriptional regulator [Planctomycetota bacterium]|nr:MAG: Rrf2 family transcriptional regulator [Planctomycetota bacterium]
MFSQTQEYALRAVTYLASHQEEGPAGAKRIAEETLVPPSYLAKVLQQLSRAGILASRRGVRGGFELRRNPDDLTVLEVVNAVDPVRRISSCPLKLKTHGTHLCPMHARLDQALRLVEEALGKSTIREVMSEPGRPLPLVETPDDELEKDEKQRACGAPGDAQ